MAVRLVTGLPGHGKTLRTIWEVEEWRLREQREVFYHGIPELTLEWSPMEDPRKWFLLPEGSIIVIDEAQKSFPVRPNGKQVPEYISEFETHRHKGLDVVLITQDQGLIDAHLRKLVERHQHLVRPFGHNYSVIFEWQQATDPRRSGVEKSALKSRWKHHPDVYKVYKSASVHTVKKRIPLKVFVIPGLIVVIVFAGWLTNKIFSRHAPQSTAQAVQSPTGVATPTSPQDARIQAALSREPLEGLSAWITGHVETGMRHQYWFDVKESPKRGNGFQEPLDDGGGVFSMTAADLGKLGYMVEPVTPCMVRLWYATGLRYVHCRGHSQEAPRDAGGGDFQMAAKESPSGITYNRPPGLVRSEGWHPGGGG